MCIFIRQFCSKIVEVNSGIGDDTPFANFSSIFPSFVRGRTESSLNATEAEKKLPKYTYSMAPRPRKRPLLLVAVTTLATLAVLLRPTTAARTASSTRGRSRRTVRDGGRGAGDVKAEDEDTGDDGQGGDGEGDGGQGGDGEGDGGQGGVGTTSSSSVDNAVPAEQQCAFDREEVDKKVKPAVVSITHSSTLRFWGDEAGTFYATGFVVDKELGIIATNRHVTGVSPSNYQVSCYDGSFLDAKLLWYDPFNDFGFLQTSEPLPESTIQISFAQFNSTSINDEVMLVGNNEGEEFTTKKGSVINLARLDDSGRGVLWQTSFDRTGGSSGSPVFNCDCEVVAIHAAGTDTTSLEIPANYLARALEQIQASLHTAGTNRTEPVKVKRGATGAILTLESLGKAVRYYGMTEEQRENVVAWGKRGGGFGKAPAVAIVESVAPETPAVDVLMPGDVLYKLAGEIMGPNVLAFDREVDAALGNAEGARNVTVTVLRNGEERQMQLRVMDLEQEKPFEYVSIDTAIFQELEFSVREAFVEAHSGVWCSFAAPGSSFEGIAGSSTKDAGYLRLLVTQINGHIIENLNDLRCMMTRLIEAGNNQYPMVINLAMKARDYYVDGNTMDAVIPVTIHLDDESAFQARKFDHVQLDWLRWTDPPTWHGGTECPANLAAGITVEQQNGGGIPGGENGEEGEEDDEAKEKESENTDGSLPESLPGFHWLVETGGLGISLKISSKKAGATRFIPLQQLFIYVFRFRPAPAPRLRGRRDLRGLRGRWRKRSR